MTSIWATGDATEQPATTGALGSRRLALVYAMAGLGAAVVAFAIENPEEDPTRGQSLYLAVALASWALFLGRAYLRHRSGIKYGLGAVAIALVAFGAVRYVSALPRFAIDPVRAAWTAKCSDPWAEVRRYLAAHPGSPEAYGFVGLCKHVDIGRMYAHGKVLEVPSDLPPTQLSPDLAGYVSVNEFAGWADLIADDHVDAHGHDLGYADVVLRDADGGGLVSVTRGPTTSCPLGLASC